MERRTKKMLLAILMIITVLTTDLYVLGSEIMTYAIELNSETNNNQVEFSTFFKKGEERVDSIEASLKNKDVKLYVEVKVKNEGYLKEGTVVEIENSNFNIKREILPSNTHIKGIEGNKVELTQINNGETIELELGIEPIIAEKMTSDFLGKVTTVKMLGTYVYSKAENGESIRTEKLVCVNYVPEEEMEAELETEIITNKEFSVKGTNQKIVQLLIKSRLTNNNYPVKQTTLKVGIPELNEKETEITAIATGELATSGISKINRMTTENGIVEITIKNEPTENNEIDWKKDLYDEIVVTYIYPETVDTSKVEITTESEITIYNSEKIYMATKTARIENQEINNIIIERTKAETKEIYKGSIYENIETRYKTETRTVITNAGVVDKVVTYEGSDKFGTEEKEASINTKYITTEVNLESVLPIIGEEGNIEIKNGEKVITINKETQTNENGNVLINYENGTSELEITINNPINAGIVELKHTKSIVENNYSRDQLRQAKTLNIVGTATGTIEGKEIVKTPEVLTTIELKETTTKAELTIENNKTTLSTTESNEITLGITLVTNGVQYDLFKNPKMSIKFPTAVTNVELISTPSKQNVDEFTLDVGAFNTTNKTMQISLKGEQTTYPKSELTQGYIQLNLKVTLNSLALAQTDKIIMAYINENAIEYDGGRTDVGIVEQAIEISAPSQLIKMYNVSSNENTSLTETILEQIDKKEAGKTKDFEISLINNKDSDISNLKILGKLPTIENTISGQETNTLETKLKGIRAENAKIYYTENTNPISTDIENEENGWTENVIENAKMYLIQLNTLARGANYIATITEQLPSTIEENGVSYSQYGVIYDTETETEAREVSRKVGLAASTVASIKTEITAQVGQDVLESGDVVKEGEVIKYTVTVKNTGANTLENVQLKLDVSEGTTFVRPIPEIIGEDGTIIQEGYVYANGYYEEVTDASQLEEATTITIPTLTITQPYEIQYEVRVNKGSANTEITNKPVIMYDETELECTEFRCTIQEANARVTVKRAKDMNAKLYANGMAQYKVYVENLSNSPINDLEMKIICDELTIQNVECVETSESYTNSTTNIQIEELKPNDTLTYIINGIINSNGEKLNIYSLVNYNKGNTLRSNLVTDTFAQYSATVNLTSPQNGKKIKEGDRIEYNIEIKNTGNIEQGIMLEMNVPNVFKVESIYKDGTIKSQCLNEENVETYANSISNEITEAIHLNVNASIQLKIIAKALYIPESYHGNIIKSNARVSVMSTANYISQQIINVLDAKDSTNNSIENIVSGFAWFDINENGEKDEDEQYLSDITVKLYDKSTNSHLKYEDGSDITTRTDKDGTYVFSNIKNGNYFLVFEYDTEKYVLTKPFAQGADSTLNSKAIIKKIEGEYYINRVAGIEVENLTGNVFDMNIGLTGNTGKTPIEEQPGKEEKPTNPQNPIEPIQPEDPTQTEDPTTPNTPNNPSNPTQPETPVETQLLNGYVWLDENLNGKKENVEPYLSGIKVRLYDTNTKGFITNVDGQTLEVTTDENGKYEFSNIEKGSYMVVFEYDTEKYKLATQNADTVLRTININGKQKTVAITNVINVQGKVYNINLILQENLKFDLELNKYISRIVVQTKNETKTYDYNGKTLGKVEIHRKQIQGALVILEYTIKVKNNGELAGTARNIIDYLPTGLTFSSELNTDWYLSGKSLYSKALENMPINPGEEKELKLVLTKTMTNENVGLINNRAEIYEDYNKYGETDIDSIPNNQAQNEDDFGTTDVIIQVATGGSTTLYIILMIINVILIFVAIKIMIKNKIIHVKTKEERR